MSGMFGVILFWDQPGIGQPVRKISGVTLLKREGSGITV